MFYTKFKDFMAKKFGDPQSSRISRVLMMVTLEQWSSIQIPDGGQSQTQQNSESTITACPPPPLKKTINLHIQRYNTVLFKKSVINMETNLYNKFQIRYN
jgi:hypothetical protein